MNYIRVSQHSDCSLLYQVISTHEDKIKSAEAAALDQINPDDERMREIGKSNIDKWLHVLLDDDCPRLSTDLTTAQSSGSPENDQPPLSPALSALSMAALRGSVEMEEARDDVSFHSCLSLSVKHHNPFFHLYAWMRLIT